MARHKINFVCKVEGCEKNAFAKGWCRPHWWRMHKYGRLEKIIGLIKGNCIIEGCGKKIKGLGLCRNHYQMYKIYKVHPNEYYKKLKEQDNKCAICGCEETSLFKNIPGKIKKLAIDHNHETGKIRGLLCWRCNSVLGRLNENVELIDKMIGYLKHHKD